MAKIYKNSTLTFATMGAKDSSQGLFLQRFSDWAVHLTIEGIQIFATLPPAPVDQQTHQVKHPPWK